jgi:hypothetical protein
MYYKFRGVVYIFGGGFFEYAKGRRRVGFELLQELGWWRYLPAGRGRLGMVGGFW